ncbi:hypothetical protein [Bacillus sp. T33-2]|uniref:hypothetical protein n=1 Tax=Bacillus sp. T33-2 TaxID=2054168 RepID=UPI000C76779F|nr:hypothetical protein [Bacillus sp. T33-2]PLR95274.1 hypothetical protein CVD19_14980 [Bacillus sp. T33-2]
MMCQGCNNVTRTLSDKFVFILSETLLEECNGLGAGVLFTAEFDGGIAYKVTWDQKVEGVEHEHSIYTYRQIQQAIHAGKFIVINNIA